MQEHEELPTGKSIMRQLDAKGRVVKENSCYGMLDIGITLEFNAGVKSGEMYFVKQRLVRESVTKRLAPNTLTCPRQLLTWRTLAVKL